MFESGVKVIDRIISLLQIREQRKRSILSDHIEPIFASMEKIHNDYLSATGELQEELKVSRDIEHILSCLKQKKMILEALRVKVDSYAKAGRIQGKYPECVEAFLNACISYFNDQYLELHSSYSGHYSRLIEIFLTKKREVEESSEAEEHLEFSLALMSDALNRTQRRLRSGWQRIADAYGKCRIELT